MIDLGDVPDHCQDNHEHPEFKVYCFDSLMYNDQWQFEYKGFQGQIIRQDQHQHLCGYIAGDIPVGINIDDIECHGGITFEEEKILGIDCMHFGDFVPGRPGECPEHVYRDTEFVIEELKKIVDQLLAFSEATPTTSTLSSDDA